MLIIDKSLAHAHNAYTMAVRRPKLPADFPQRLRECMRLQRREFPELSAKTDISPQHLRKIAEGAARPSVLALRSLCGELGDASKAYLTGGTQKLPPFVKEPR
jgi:transcriptional regulator with XRE-family HTH domain